jgi:hypothetical protein
MQQGFTLFRCQARPFDVKHQRAKVECSRHD